MTRSDGSAAPQRAAPVLQTDEERHAAVRARDPRADGRFVYAVATTGIYCRPSCPSKRARRENVAFFADPAAARRAGYRACRRCRPDEASLLEQHAALVARARAALDAGHPSGALAAIAAEAGVSTAHLHRLFARHLGLGPRAYAAAHRLRAAERELRAGASVTTAIHAAGYRSSSRFYEAASGALGMAPARLARGGAGVAMRALVTECTLGRVLVAATARGVCAVAFGDDPSALRDELRARFPRAQIDEADAALTALAARVLDVIESSAPVAAEVPLDLMGTAIQQKVWRALGQIAPGTTVSYGELARRIDAPAAVRAVGTACGQNPVAVLVPCHRALRADGSLGGYRWGLARKQRLLARERG